MIPYRSRVGSSTAIRSAGDPSAAERFCPQPFALAIAAVTSTLLPVWRWM